jgi:predicted alpha-1,6-mannanase (GH76 family)
LINRVNAKQKYLCLSLPKNAILGSMQTKSLCALLLFFFATLAVQAFDAQSADKALAAYTSAFYVASNGFAYFKEDTSGGHSRFWVRAEQIEMMEDAYDRTHSAATREMLEQLIAGFLRRHGTDWTTNIYNDDIMWMTIACARGYLATGNTAWRDAAKQNFDAVYARGYDDVLGGGLYWTTGKKGKHSCVNGPAAIAACLLCQIYHDKSYLAEAEALYTWERAALFNPSTGAIYDNMRVSGRLGRKTFTYNEGTFIGAADLLWKLTGDTNYFNDVVLAANFTREKISKGKTLPDYPSGDAAGFNGIFLRWLTRFVEDDHLWPQYYPWMKLNADAAWRVRRADDLSWQKWDKRTPEGTLDSWNCSDAVVILQVVPAKEPK